MAAPADVVKKVEAGFEKLQVWYPQGQAPYRIPGVALDTPGPRLPFYFRILGVVLWIPPVPHYRTPTASQLSIAES